MYRQVGRNLRELARRCLGRPSIVLALCLTDAALGMAQTPTAPASNLVSPPVWTFNDFACAPFITIEAPIATLRIVGSQDTVIKRMLGPGDTLVISGGSNAGLAAGQEYYVRRLARYGDTSGPDAEHPVSVHTAGWIRILGVDSAIATATVVHACDGILLDDYLEPYSPPTVAAQTLPGGTVQYENMGRILTGDQARQFAGPHDLMNIDHGSQSGVLPGQRFLVFRDKRATRADASDYSLLFQENAARLPLVEIGEVVVVAVRPNGSTVQVTRARDVIQLGDLIAPIQ